MANHSHHCQAWHLPRFGLAPPTLSYNNPLKKNLPPGSRKVTQSARSCSPHLSDHETLLALSVGMPMSTKSNGSFSYMKPFRELTGDKMNSGIEKHPLSSLHQSQSVHIVSVTLLESSFLASHCLALYS